MPVQEVSSARESLTMQGDSQRITDPALMHQLCHACAVGWSG